MFNIDDKVVRTGDSYEEVEHGETYTVVDVDGDGVHLKGLQRFGYNPKEFKLVEDTSKNRPHHDMIIAWAKGADIEWFDGRGGVWKDIANTTFYENTLYRIKPNNTNTDQINRIESEIQRLADELKELRDENLNN
jgi:hypothetical protein